MSPPAVTRAIASLEERLGVKLLNRTTRYVRSTDAGLRYLDDARRIIAEVDEADEMAQGVNAAARGHLAVTAPVLFGKMFVLPGIIDFLERFPEVEVSAVFLDRVVNLLEEGFDVGIRIGELPDSTMKARPLGFVRKIVCASAAYLHKNGSPRNPQELTDHTLIAANMVSPSLEWKFGHGQASSSVRVKPRLTVSNNDSAIEAAIQGFGITRLLSYQAAPYVSTGKLKIILSEYEPLPIPIHVIHREGRYASGKVRVFVDLITEKLKQELASMNQGG
jgi:DNA-binding transcriptional LysR family regulator